MINEKNNELLKLREKNIIKIGDNCLKEIAINDKLEKLYCPYRENNCDNKICAKFMAYLDVNDHNVVKEEINEMGFDIDNMETLELLMSMQIIFASNFHKVVNLSKTEQEHWINTYLVCIEDEVREVREHLKIYPDKVNITNKDEMKKEVIDILHFMMDEFICGGATFKDIKKYYLKEYYPIVLDTTSLLSFAFDMQKNDVEEIYNKHNYDMNCLLLINKLLDCNGEVRQCISWKHWKKPSDSINYEKLYTAFAHTFKVFIDLCIYINMSEQEIKDIYIKKNLENRFRKKWGY